MPINILIEDGIVVLGGFGQLMNDPRYIDAGRDIQETLDQGRQKFVLDLGGMRETGSSFLGLLMTIARRIQRQGGTVVLAQLSRQMKEFLVTMQMDEYWDEFPTVAEAIASLRREPRGLRHDEPD